MKPSFFQTARNLLAAGLAFAPSPAFSQLVTHSADGKTISIQCSPGSFAYVAQENTAKGAWFITCRGKENESMGMKIPAGNKRPEVTHTSRDGSAATYAIK